MNISMPRQTARDRQRLREIADTMLTKGYAEMDVDPSILAETVPSICEGIRLLTDIPEFGALFPQQIPSTDEMGWNMEAGLLRRIGKDESGNAEDKFFFHFIPGVGWRQEEGIERFVRFWSDCERLNTTARNIALVVAKEIDELHGVEDPEKSLFHAIARSTTVTRVLRYKGLANAYIHLDRGAISIAWWASHLGLVIVDEHGQRHRVDEQAWDRVALFFGKKFAGFFEGQYGLGTLHGAKDARDESNDATEDRISIVSFIHAKLTSEQALWIKEHTPQMDALEKAHSL